MEQKYPEKDAGGHPFWSGAVIGFLHAVEMRLIPPQEVAMTAGEIIRDLLNQGMLANLADLEKYAREQNLPLYLAAMPIAEADLPDGIVSRDPVTREPRDHWLNILVGQPHPQDQNGQRVFELSADQETNLARLAQTGMLYMEP